MQTSNTLTLFTRGLSHCALAAGLCGLPMLGHAQSYGGTAMGRVLNATPIIQQVAVPQQYCNQEQVYSSGNNNTSGAGAVIGGLAGGAIGNQIGRGSGRAAATALGIVGGAVLGNQIESGRYNQPQTVQRCNTQTYYENRTVGYNVTYEYAGQQYTTQTTQHPGAWIPLQGVPVAPTTYVQPAATTVITQETTYIVPPGQLPPPRPYYYTTPGAGGSTVWIEGETHRRGHWR